MEIRLRRPEYEDLVSIVNFELELARHMGCFKKNPEGVGDFYRLKNKEFGIILNFPDPRSNMVLAEVDNKVVGYVNYNSVSDKFHINSLYVNPEFRRNGIGKKILSVLVREADSKGKQEISVVPFGSRDFYRNFGFIDSNKYSAGKMIFKVESVH